MKFIFAKSRSGEWCIRAVGAGNPIKHAADEIIRACELMGLEVCHRRQSEWSSEYFTVEKESPLSDAQEDVEITSLSVRVSDHGRTRSGLAHGPIDVNVDITEEFPAEAVLRIARKLRLTPPAGYSEQEVEAIIQRESERAEQLAEQRSERARKTAEARRQARVEQEKALATKVAAMMVNAPTVTWYRACLIINSMRLNIPHAQKMRVAYRAAGLVESMKEQQQAVAHAV